VHMIMCAFDLLFSILILIRRRIMAPAGFRDRNTARRRGTPLPVSCGSSNKKVRRAVVIKYLLLCAAVPVCRGAAPSDPPNAGVCLGNFEECHDYVEALVDREARIARSKSYYFVNMHLICAV